ncbi:MAG: PIG-L family deacetylase [Clostridia bacterium]|nr:PIG-L family deacetylase [Clostridia bacterium]
MKRLLSLICCAVLLLSLLPAPAAESAKAKNITHKCKFTATSGSINKVKDGNFKSYKEYWESRSGSSTIKIAFPKGVTPGGIVVEWFVPFKEFEYRQYAAGPELLSAESSDEYFKGHVTYLAVDPSAIGVELEVRQSGKICKITVFSAGQEIEGFEKWNKNVPEKVDLLLIVAHQDDEELWFGGLLPYYGVVREKDVQVVFMTNCSRSRIKESLNGLYVMGLRNVPEVAGFKNAYLSYSECVDIWGGSDNIVHSLVRMIRMYKPDVLVTHDLNGEYGHPQHKVTARHMEEAVKAAKDPSRYPDSAELYGVWEVKKLYIHLSDTDAIYMDWNTPSEALGGKTPLQVATLGYKQHKSQQKAYSMEDGKKYDNTKFGLVYSAVGKDVNRNDLFENIEPVPENY